MKSKEKQNVCQKEELSDEALSQVSGGGIYYEKPHRGYEVNPEDSCRYGMCRDCEDYIAGVCCHGLG